MKAVILADGFGRQLGEEAMLRPKPMVEIGGRPILWHIMKIYASHGVRNFVVCAGYKGFVIKEYFKHYFLHSADVTIDLSSNRVEYGDSHSEPWRVTIIDTGEKTMTGGRLKRVLPYLADDEDFCLAYGDVVSDVDIGAMIAFHRRRKRFATLAAVQMNGKYGAIELMGDHVADFHDGPSHGSRWINGGLFVLSTEVGRYIASDASSWEFDVLPQLAREGQLAAYRHLGFWQSMGAIYERNLLDGMWRRGQAPWKVWK